MKSLVFACFGVLVSACSSGVGGMNASDGSFVVADAVATEQVDFDTMQITLSSIGGVCGLMQTGSAAPARDYDVVTFTFRSTQPGTYPLVAGDDLRPDAAQALYVGNRSCTSKYGSFASGTVTITSVDDGHVTGTYDMHFANGWPYGANFKGSTQGSFDAPVCDTLGHLPAITCN